MSNVQDDLTLRRLRPFLVRWIAVGVVAAVGGAFGGFVGSEWRLVNSFAATAVAEFVSNPSQIRSSVNPETQKNSLVAPLESLSVYERVAISVSLAPADMSPIKTSSEPGSVLSDVIASADDSALAQQVANTAILQAIDIDRERAGQRDDLISVDFDQRLGSLDEESLRQDVLMSGWEEEAARLLQMAGDEAQSGSDRASAEIGAWWVFLAVAMVADEVKVDRPSLEAGSSHKADRPVNA